MRAAKRRALTALVAAMLAGCFGGDDESVSSPSDVRYAFVVLGPDGRAIARAITAARTCPAIAIDGGRPVQMSLRAAAATLPPRPTAYEKHNTVPAEFPIAVCETILPAGVARASIGARSLPVPRAHPRTILLVGDSGCRMKQTEKAGDFQACNDPTQWPFAAVAASAAAMAPDLVIHVGDYHYRESACPPGNAGCQGSAYGYSWSSWEPDFFAPAQPLLAQAPWIMVRGNHEVCDRGGQGWWRMLAAQPLVVHQDCNDVADDDIGNYSEPFAVPFDDDSAFLVFDSSVVKDEGKLQPGERGFDVYDAQLRQLFMQSGRFANAFFVNHQPALGYNSEGSGHLGPGNEGLQSVLETMFPVTLFPPNVQAVLSGHIHVMQIVGYATPQPPTFIPGNGGTAMIDEVESLPPGDTPLPGAVVNTLRLAREFGFMTMERTATGWTITSFDRHGRVITNCVLAAKKAACSPIPG